MDLQDKILTAVVCIQDDVKELNEKVGHIETVQNRVYDKLDGFMMLVNRHEAEIAAVRSRLQRLEDRFQELEDTRIRQ